MDRRRFLSSSAAAGSLLLTPALARAALRAEDRAGDANPGPPLPGPFRLPAEWYRATTGRFQAALATKGLDGAVITGSDNVNYLTGSFATTTERVLYVYVPAKGEPAVFHPGLDRDLWGSWWIKDREWYFDYRHHGAFGRVVYEPGPPADLFAWMVAGIVKRGAGKRLGFESPLAPSDLATLKKNGMTADAQSVSAMLMAARQVKTPEEVALSRTSIELHDRILAFARDYILQHGTDATDFEVSHAGIAFGTQELMRALGGELDGRPHHGVGISIDLECRTGPATAYPHPNQFFFRKIQRGDALQIATAGRVGGYGGEGYRAMQIEGPGVTALHDRLWEVHTAMTVKQQELSKAGVACNVVAAAVLKLARDAGFENHVYHRPAHGEGAEGHQPPYLSLGDTYVLQENNFFSNEPGLYHPAGGFGYNHSNCVRVTKIGGEQMNRTPLTKAWCWLKL